MEPSSGPGHDRRARVEFVGNNRKTGSEHCNIIDRIEQYTGILKKIPVFKELTIGQLKRILSISSYKTLDKNEILCNVGDESLEIYILISGQLSVTFPDGKEITRINPPGIVGEMGFFTGEPRSANIVTGKESIIITINKTKMTILLKQDPEMCRILLVNVICDLSNKLRNINEIFNKLIHLYVIE